MSKIDLIDFIKQNIESYEKDDSTMLNGFFIMDEAKKCKYLFKPEIVNDLKKKTG